MRSILLAACLAVSATAARADETCTVILDAATGVQLVREGTICDRRLPPQSSFKLPLALMGFDSGVLVDEHNPRWDWRPERGDARDVEKTTQDPQSWLTISVVWFSQQLTRTLGSEKFAGYVTAFDYGNRDVSGDPGKSNGLTRAWLSSSLRISPDQQAAFMRKVVTRALPVSPRAYEMTERSLPSFAAGDWRVQGKTGSGWLRNAAGKIDRNAPVGWFVGWAAKGDRTIAFARAFVGDKPSKAYGGMIARDGFLKELPSRVQ